MTAVVGEKFESRKVTTGESPTVELIYFISGTQDDQETEQSGLVSVPCPCKACESSRWAEGFGTALPLTVAGNPKKPATPAAGKRIGRSPAPDFGGAIGVTHDNVEGVNVTVPVYSFAETHYIDVDFVTSRRRPERAPRQPADRGTRRR